MPQVSATRLTNRGWAVSPDGADLMLQKIRADVGEPRSAAKSGGGWDAYIRVPGRPEPPGGGPGARTRNGRGERVWAPGVRGDRPRRPRPRPVRVSLERDTT